MKTFSFLALYGLATITFATLNDLPDIPDLDPVTQTDQTCQTFYGTRSLNYVPTYTSNGCTTTITAPTYVTTFDTTTSTPDPTSITDTITVTTTTQPTVTSTCTLKATSKSLITSYCTKTTYTTTYTTKTVNAAQSTTTITAPAGFKYPKPTPGYGKRSELEERTFGWLFGNRGGNRGGNNWGNRRPNRFSPNPFWMKFMQNGKGGRCYRESPKKYPKAVVCRNDIAIIVPKIVNVAGDLVTETACQPTSWITETETATSTLPVANAVTTITTTTSVTCTTNIKITTTVPCVKTRTQTNSPPQATYYEQCGTKNQVTRDSNGNRIALYSEAGADFNPTQDADSAYDCCVACIMTNQAALKDSSAQSYCAGSNYVDSPNDSVQTCQLNLYSTCANPVTQSRIAMNYYSSDIGVDVTVSNGPAGYYQYVDSSGKPL